MNMSAVGVYLQRQRNEAGLTQRDIAEELGVVERTVSDWEAGRYVPSFDLMVRFVRLIHGQVEKVASLLFDGDPQPNRRAEFAALALTLSDEELDRVIETISILRAAAERDVQPAADVPPRKRARRRRDPG